MKKHLALVTSVEYASNGYLIIGLANHAQDIYTVYPQNITFATAPIDQDYHGSPSTLRKGSKVDVEYGAAGTLRSLRVYSDSVCEIDPDTNRLVKW